MVAGLNRRLTIILHDLGMAAVAWYLAWLARFNLAFPYPRWELSLQLLPEILIIQGFVFWYFGLYRGLWRFASIPDLWNIIKAALLGALSISLVLFIQTRLQGIPRSILVLYPLFLILLLGGPRLGYRLFKDRRLTLDRSVKKRVLIIGAGRAGETLVRDMLREEGGAPVGFLDDDPELAGSRVHGLPVYGGIDQVKRVVDQYEVDLIIIAVPSATGQQMQRIVAACEETNLPMRTLPSLQDMMSGRPALSDLRELSIEDLLGRDKVDLDWPAIRQGIHQKVVLVSGGGGSIGSELCRQIAALAPAQLIIVERSEFNLYRIHADLEANYPQVPLVAVLGDVCDRQTVDRVLEQYQPQVIFHAAAYKHVPILEQYLREAVQNNIIGTRHMAESAARHACEKFVLISTDKAVNPINMLGKTKRAAEILCDSMNGQSATRYITVRFGNVLGSDGSVVPLFQRQIREGGPVTVTHPDMQRYFMTIPESCQLILQAGAMGEGGEIFVLDMGQPVRIAYLAEQMIRLSGQVPNRDIEIQFTGLRPGEKLDEELFHDGEMVAETCHPKILLARHTRCSHAALNELWQAMQEAATQYEEQQLRELIEQLVPSPATDGEAGGNIISLHQHKVS
ncbi:FlaA1/EpsC-like NDP-sugar epimerase [Methylohalomonas lacus]|uniref:FlaA1/EpsC-like NDP-sugar epimerase n=1 Tax=Methylohalomonas lacus TaxID=398773 RepID=A0AAE3L221_9GAMM|nr:nucleoside-diphosphate sugar epimerase/dehydratase [Methylohalomonas lacus]MCS3904390.1 FlaA1/EpsC-like NDP-sugar epimerase [Methylohalomonas lacus]